MQERPKLDMFTMVILKQRFEAFITEMMSALYRSGRSSVLNTGLDFSCSITDAKFQSISLALGLPMHVGSIDLIPKAVVKKFGSQIRPGDCFATNSGYYGNTHCADFTLCAPVFYKDELCFFTIARAHFADMGFPTPTTYSPKARDVYEEGLMLPCVRIQRDYQDLSDVIDICKANIRAPEHFYGDYLGTLAAVRTGEKRIISLCDKYGLEFIRAFVDEYQDYAERMAIEAIRKLPKGTVEREAMFDSELEILPDGIPIRARLTVDPDEANILIDLTDNIDNLPLGINMTESTVLASCMVAVFNALGPEVPRCSGSFRRVEVKMREGCLVGKPKFPAATSAATSNICHLLISHIQSMFAELSDGLGSAYGSVGAPGSAPVISGMDPRRDNKPFVDQILLACLGGPAIYGYDGWLTWATGGSQGAIRQASVEITELQVPILVEKLSIRSDSQGSGRWDGAPGGYCVLAPRITPVRFTTNSAAHRFPPQGVRGGLPGAITNIWKVDAGGERTEQPITMDAFLNPGEKHLSEQCGGGGYGDPLDREPERVRWKAREEWISLERARDVYGVVLDTSTEQYAVDWEATKKLREELRQKGQSKK